MAPRSPRYPIGPVDYDPYAVLAEIYARQAARAQMMAAYAGLGTPETALSLGSTFAPPSPSPWSDLTRGFDLLPMSQYMPQRPLSGPDFDAATDPVELLQRELSGQHFSPAPPMPPPADPYRSRITDAFSPSGPGSIVDATQAASAPPSPQSPTRGLDAVSGPMSLEALLSPVRSPQALPGPLAFGPGTASTGAGTGAAAAGPQIPVRPLPSFDPPASAAMNRPPTPAPAFLAASLPPQFQGGGFRPPTAGGPVEIYDTSQSRTVPRPPEPSSILSGWVPEVRRAYADVTDSIANAYASLFNDNPPTATAAVPVLPKPPAAPAPPTGGAPYNPLWSPTSFGDLDVPLTTTANQQNAGTFFPGVTSGGLATPETAAIEPPAAPAGTATTPTVGTGEVRPGDAPATGPDPVPEEAAAIVAAADAAAPVMAATTPQQQTSWTHTGRQDLGPLGRFATSVFAPFIGGRGGGGFVGPNGFFSNAGSFTPSGIGGSSPFNQQIGGGFGSTNWRQGSVTGNPAMGGVMWNRSGDNGSVGYVTSPFTGDVPIYSGSPNRF